MGNPLGGFCAQHWFDLKQWLLVPCLTNAARLRRNESRVGWRPVVLEVVQCSVFALPNHSTARGAGCDATQRGFTERSCRCRINAGGRCLGSAITGRARPTRPCSRPLRAQDRAVFDTFWQRAAADGQLVGRLGQRGRSSRGGHWRWFGMCAPVAPGSSCPSPLCRRGTTARGADRPLCPA
jgi:hypothetical protein